MPFHPFRAIRALFEQDQAPEALPSNVAEQIFAALIQPGDVCFDVGAHIGDVSLYLARRSGPTGRVISFEPVWPTFERLCASIQKRDHPRAPIFAVPFGLSDQEGSLTIRVPGDDFAQASLASVSDWQDSHANVEMTEHECQFVTLDSFVESKHLPYPELLKVDVEGAELLVFKGAKTLLAGKRPPLIFVEIFAPWEKAFGYAPFDVLSMLAGFGYKFLFVCPGGLVDHTPTEDEPFPPAYEGGCNTLAFVPEHHDARVANLTKLRAGGEGKLLPLDTLPMPNRIEPT